MKALENMKENENRTRGYQFKGLLNLMGGLVAFVITVQIYGSIYEGVSGAKARLYVSLGLGIVMGMEIVLYAMGIYYLISVRRYMKWREEHDPQS